MGWARFDDGYTDHPKVIEAGPWCELLDMRAVIYCARYETDGLITAAALRHIGRGIPSAKTKARKLVEVGRWHDRDHDCAACPEAIRDQFRIHAYLSYNPSSEQKENERADARDRMKRAREAKRSPEHHPNTQVNFAVGSQEVRVTPTRPDPIENSSLDSHTRTNPQPVDNSGSASCPRCQGRGTYWNAGAGTNTRCECTRQQIHA